MDNNGSKKGDSINALSCIVFTHPLCVLVFCFAFFCALPIAVLFMFPLQLGNNPEKGFETDRTPYAGPRLAWNLLQPSLLQGSRVPLLRAEGEQEERERPKRAWTDELIASFGSVACYDNPIPAMSFLAQFVLTVPSLEHLFSHELLHKICRIGDDLAHQLTAFHQFTPHRTIWSFANYVACLTPASRVNCTFANSDDVDQFRHLFNQCLLHRRAILACRRDCQRHNQWTTATSGEECPEEASSAAAEHCVAVPPECDGQMWFDLFYRILPEDLSQRPLPINAFLPFYSFAAYHLQGFPVPLRAFTDAAEQLHLVAERSQGHFSLRGLSMDIKRDILLEAAVRDARLSQFAALAVFLLLTLYSLSLAFAIAVLFQLVASVLSALAVYRAFTIELPLLNLIAFVLLISVGSDGAFLLLDKFPAAEKLRVDSLNRSLMHTAKTMFLTQFSTVVPFLLNLLSGVFAFRSFGLFAGLTLVFNYVLLVSFLPAFLVLQHRHLNPWLVKWWPSRLWYCFPSSTSSHASLERAQQPTTMASVSRRRMQPPAGVLPSRVPSTWVERSLHFVATLIDEVLPAVLVQGRFVWLCSLSVVLVASAYVCISQLSLPRYNPLQLFRASNPHEYFDQNAERLFPFVADKIAALPLAIRLVWGLRPASARSYFDPNQVPSLPEPNPHFRLRTVAQMRALPFVEHRAKFWPERFLEWSALLKCDAGLEQRGPPLEQQLCCNVHSPRFSADQLDTCIRLSTVQLHANYNDTLVWDNSTHELVGYTALLPTRLHYSHRFANLSSSFAQFDKWLAIGGQVSFLPGWYTTEWAVMSQWFDLQRSIIADCWQSILVSFLVVFLFAATLLRLKAFGATLTIFCIVLSTVGTLVFIGWEIGVLEGVILVLVVGLSFDYTLHYGALIPSKGCSQHRVQRVVKGAARSVGMAAMSSILAGGVMLMAETHAFFQVALFLVVCSSLSLLFATFFFLPLFCLFTPSSPGNNDSLPTTSNGVTGRENSVDCEQCASLLGQRRVQLRKTRRTGHGPPS